MKTEIIMQLIVNLGVIPGLFVWLLYDTRKEHREDKKQSKHREERLMIHLDKVSTSLENISRSQEKIEMRMERIENSVGI